ncbi:hypothetical protein HGH93_24845 [Chitinophaga polysaccharea]|uniref:hypothetical protein n=1 Tax=Chitinophaga TaxID=79328 RepID=UPI001455167E|nr:MULTISPECIES: hypothetical protein [Chitinophaga]NLR61352.1 hypothetical protein [Chitinophaga polysaccharea]NLU95187.1 hypothetical protein [Chitinophaga sp. Ak27]
MRTIYSHSSIIYLIIALFFFAGNSFAQTPLTSPAHIGLVYPLSSNGKNAAAYTNHFSLHIIAGLSKAETGVAIAGISNIIKEQATGVQIGCFSNHIGTTYHAATIAGFMNHVKGNAGGATLAGFLNLINGNVNGFQGAGFANLGAKDVNGTQMAGFINTAQSNAQAQLAGFSNIVKDKAAVQVAGFLNKADTVQHQIAGFINIAKKVKGVQVAGFINIADSSEYPIGLVNIVKGGEKQVSVSIDETMTTIAAFKSGGRVLYGILGIGYNLKDNPNPLYALQGGIGAHLPLTAHFRINGEALNTVLTDFKKGYYHRQTVGIFPAYRFGNRVEIFAGPTFNFVSTKHDVGRDLVSHYIWSEDVSRNRFHGAYIGAAGGIQVTL